MLNLKPKHLKKIKFLRFGLKKADMATLSLIIIDNSIFGGKFKIFIVMQKFALRLKNSF